MFSDGRKIFPCSFDSFFFPFLDPITQALSKPSGTFSIKLVQLVYSRFNSFQNIKQNKWPKLKNIDTLKVKNEIFVLFCGRMYEQHKTQFLTDPGIEARYYADI